MKLLSSVWSLSLAVVLVAFAVPGPPIQAGQPTAVLGFQPAYTDQSIELPLPGSMGGPRTWREIRCRLSISSSGAIDSIALEKPGDSIWVRRVADTLMKVSLRPAHFEGNPVPCLLPASITIRPRSPVAELLLPFNPNGSIRIYNDYMQCLRANGLEPARVDSFPRYFFERSAVDSLVNEPPYLLVRLELDSTGRLIGSQIVASTLPVYDRQIVNAVHWAEFSPARIHGAEVGAPMWLLFTVYSQSTFPAPVWRTAEVENMRLWERLRLRALPDTVGLMHYPVPRRANPLVWSADGAHASIRDTVSAVLSVDTLGRAGLSWVSTGNPTTLSAMRRIVGGLRFWPATGFDGRTREFEGRMRFIFGGVRTVRMEFPWLPL